MRRFNTVEWNNEVYYKIIIDYETDKFSIIEMQYFDESDYIQDRILADRYGNQYNFSKEYEAIKWLNNNIKPEYIEEKFKIVNNSFNREKYFINPYKDEGEE